MVIEYHGFPEIGQNLHKILAILDRNGFRYMIHDFDSETNSASKPPFHLVEESRFFLLIYAKRLNNAKEGHPTAGDPLRSQPASRQFGFDRGTPIDRHYIEKFLDDHRPLIRGRVLEIGDASYTRRFGRDVARSEVLSAAPGAGVTLVGDLATGVNIPESAFDCIIMTQTIQMIYDVGSALGNAAKALRPGGSLLLTAPGISQISRYDMDRWGDYWRFTDKSLHKLLVEAAPDCEVTIGTHGNVAVAKAFLDGLALQELHPAILDYHDPDYQLVITATVTKPLAAKEPATASPVVLIYHRVSDLPLDPQLLCVSLENFDLHLRELASSRRVVPLFQLLGECRTGKPPAGSVALTFDDGYLDNLTNALPLLERYGLHATIFVTSGMVGSDEEFWWDALERIFLTGEKLPPGLDFGNRHWPLLTDEDKIAAYEDLCSMLRDFHPEAIDHSLRYLFEWGGISRIGRLSHRSVDHRQLRELATSPHIEIGAHAKHHVRLSNLPEHRQHVEILASKQQLEAAIGKPVRLFSYPFGAPGDFGQETAKAAAAAGFEAAIANVQGEVVLPLDFYSVPRRLVRNWNGAEFAGWLLTSDRNTLEAETTTKRLSVLRDALQAGERAFRQP
jgi:peptidoglycan/xylan/chitin deacetylase (PgdA/CDA1 family)/SAM-dependent methyltransferase